jgi:predicted HicB family RNase H-like nuclease
MPDTVAVMPRKSKVTDKPATQKQGTDTVRVERDLAEMATIVAIRRKISVSELISPHLRPFIEAEYASEVKEMNKQLPRP